VCREFQQIDVFGARPFSGNPLAVVVDAEGLSTEEMQGFTRWMNLSETTFLLPPTVHRADYRVRIFSLARELPFAGHPTLGSCHAWLTAGGKSKQSDLIVQECGAGLISVRTSASGLAFAAPPLIRSGEVESEVMDQIVAVLGVDREQVADSRWVDNGPGWVGILLSDASAVLDLEPDVSNLSSGAGLDIGVIGPYPEGSEYAFEVRAFFSDDEGDLREDPVTGSLNASLAQWMLDTGRAKAPYTIRQGTRLRRDGRPHISQDDDGTVWVGGTTSTYIRGAVEI
jgi:PhzF family phenazine biosynthesis protein